MRSYFGSTAGGNYHTYTAQYNTGTGHIDMLKDGSTLQSTNFNPIGVWSQPFEPDYEGETHDNGDDVAGTSSNPTFFLGMAWQQTAGGSYQDISNVGISSDSSRYGYKWYDPISMEIWTK